jgi:hypothetical protein
VYLARKGFTVLAGVRKDRDAQALKGAFGILGVWGLCGGLLEGWWGLVGSKDGV